MYVFLPLLLALGSGDIRSDNGLTRFIEVTDALETQEVRVAPHQSTLVEFSENFYGRPICRGCAPESQDELFCIDVSPNGKALTIKLNRPARPRTRQPDGVIISGDEDYLVPVVVPLMTSTFTFYLKYVPDLGQSDRGVMFVVKRERRSQGTDPILRALALRLPMQPKGQKVPEVDPDPVFTAPHICAELSGRSYDDQDVRIEAEELCRFGSRYYLRLALLKKTRPFIQVGKLSARYWSGSDFVEAASAQQFIDVWQPNGMANAIVSWQGKEGGMPPHRFEVTAHEGGGRGRSFTVSQIVETN